VKKKINKWFTPYSHPDPVAYEHYLEELALKGWLLNKVDALSSFRMTFDNAEPKQYRYVVDLQPIVHREYKQIHLDLGWEYLGKMASVVVWRKEYSGERPESFSDPDSLRRRNKRFSTYIGIAFILLLIAAVIDTIAIPIISVALPRSGKSELDILLDSASYVITVVTIDVFAVIVGWAWFKVKDKSKP